MTIRILQGNCVETLAQLADESVHAVVTSPPYWGLRDYGTPPLAWPAVSYSPMAGLPALEVPAMECSLGLEPTLESFVGHLVLVFREVRRVLRSDGSIWVNMGDSYAGTRGLDPALTGAVASRRRDDAPVPRSDVRVPGLKPKDMLGQPWRLAFALQADGWWLRSECIWAKPNPMPESTKDRPTKAHEQLFLLSKSERYHFDHDAIKEPGSAETIARYGRGRSADHKHAGAGAVPGQRPQTIAQGFEHMRKPVGGWASGSPDHTAIGHQRPDGSRRTKLIGNGVGWGHGSPGNEKPRSPPAEIPSYRAKRTVWRIPTEGVAEAHFATFPTKLVEPCILASCPPGGTVLDPFGGSGTVGLVADRHQRHAVLCELSAEYIAIARRRLTRDHPLLTHLEGAHP